MLSSPKRASSNVAQPDHTTTATAKPQHGASLSVSAAEFIPGGIKGGVPPDTGQQPRQQQGGRGQHRGARGGRGGGRSGGRDAGGGRGGGLSKALQEGAARDQHGQHPQHSPRPHHGQHSKQQHPQQQRRGQQQQQQQAQQHTQAAADGAQLRQEQQQQQHYSSRDVQQQQRQGPRSSGGGGEADGGEGGRPSSASRPAVAAGRGRQVANHLLNFQYETRGPPRGGRGGRVGPGAYSGGRRRPPPAYRPQRYDKDKFLQANFRFLVSGAVDTKQFESDADRMFDWDDVLLVDMRSLTPVQCPISLDSPPVCPQITPCGHVFSFGSIMRHLMTHGGEQLRRSAPCPLCYQPLVARELRLVQIHHVQPPAVGDSITFQLLRRPKGSIIPVPVTDTAAAGAADAATQEAGAVPGSLDSTGSSSGALTASKWAARKAAAAAGTGAADAAPPAAAGQAVAYSSVSTPLLENPFAKFATLSDPRPLWRAASRELGQQLAEVLAQGGLEADFEAPGLFAAADCLAQRARRFAEHQASQLLQRGVPIGAVATPGLSASSGGGGVPGAIATSAAAVAAGWPTWLAADPQVAGQEADSLIRDAFTLAIDSGKAALTAAEQEQQVAAEFPSLAATVGSPASPPSRGSGRPQQQGTGAGGASGTTPLGAGRGLAASTAAVAPLPQQQQQQQVQAPKAPEPEPAGMERQSSRPELFFDHAFSEDEEDDHQQQQQQQQQEGAQTTDASPQLPTEDSNSAGHSSARGIPGGGAPGAADSSAALFGTSPGTSGLLGSSPTTSAMNTASLSGDYYMYQAADGQWLFLHPLNLRCLLHAFGSYAACPPTVNGKVVELEDMTQDEGSRRRWKFLGHLPLNGTFRLGEVTLTQPHLTPAQLAPMAEELAAREKRRKRRADFAKRESRREAAAAAAAAKARQGPTAAELRSMPRLGQGADGALDAGVPTSAGAGGIPAELQGLTPEQLEEALAAQAMHESALEAGGSAYGSSPPAGGVSFARIAELGFAATGPALGSSPAAAGSSGSSGPAPGAAAAAAPKGVWGAASSSGKSAAARLSGGAPPGGSGGGAGTPAGLLTKSSWGVGGASSSGAGRPASASGAEGGAAGSSAGMGAQQWLVLGGKEGGAAEGAGEAGAAAGSSSSKKGKKEKKGVVLFATGQQRRY